MARNERIQKTNAMRELERAGLAYTLNVYETDDSTPESGYGVHVAELLGKDPDASFKTLVLKAASNSHVVCCIPVAAELDLKKAARAAGEKSLEMIHVAELEPLTGYVRGGCSPVGMKKRFLTLIDETAQLFDAIDISGGRRGISLTLSPDDLAKHTDATYADIVAER